MSGLFLVTLPIGNLKDITERAREVLTLKTDFYAEDTRVFKALLVSLGIDFRDKRIDSFHDHSSNKIESIVELIASGKEVCLVSDAGSPVISDPAYPLIRKVIEKGFDVHTIPGVTSVIAALELSGLPAIPFHFWGFLPRSSTDKRLLFTRLLQIKGTHIFFESPKRVVETTFLFFDCFPELELVFAREITKKFESVYRIKKNQIEGIEEIVTKGEFVLLFHNDDQREFDGNNEQIKQLINQYLEGKGNTKLLAKIFSSILDEDVKITYSRLSRSVIKN